MLLRKVLQRKRNWVSIIRVLHIKTVAEKYPAMPQSARKFYKA